MPYDEAVAKRVDTTLDGRKGFTKTKMFGGIAHLLNGNLCCAIWTDYLVLRVGLEAYQSILQEPYVKPFDLTGRTMRGWVMVAPEGFYDDEALADWLEQAVQFVRTLPAKVKKKAKKKPKRTKKEM